MPSSPLTLCLSVSVPYLIETGKEKGFPSHPVSLPRSVSVSFCWYVSSIFLEMRKGIIESLRKEKGKKSREGERPTTTTTSSASSSIGHCQFGL
jgi:hypothetical protein